MSGAVSILLGAGLAASVPAAHAGAVPALAASGLAAQARQIQTQAVADAAELHALATEVDQSGARLQAVDAEIASDDGVLSSLHVKMTQAASTLRQVALDQYMQDTSAAGLDEFLGSPTQQAVTDDYQELVTGKESDALAAYQQVQAAVTRQQAELADAQAAATSDYQAMTHQYAALQASAQAEQADLAKVHQEQAYLVSEGPPRSVDFTDLVSGNGSLAQSFYRLRQCESGDDYQDDTGNGYYGAYQFSPSTWEGLGYGGLPSGAPPPEQDQAAYQLYQRAGWSQWPECAAMLGLD
jgi:hypothetical protein